MLLQKSLQCSLAGLKAAIIGNLDQIKLEFDKLYEAQTPAESPILGRTNPPRLKFEGSSLFVDEVLVSMHNRKYDAKIMKLFLDKGVKEWDADDLIQKLGFFKKSRSQNSTYIYQYDRLTKVLSRLRNHLQKSLEYSIWEGRIEWLLICDRTRKIHLFRT